MLYLLETKLLETKPIFVELTKIHGINKTHAHLICKKLGFSFNFKVSDLTIEQTQDIFIVIESLNLILNNDLKTLKAQNIETLVSIKTYRGLRRVQKLPVRGQRTHTNAKSAKKGIF
jgi:small subunit ribosomal protein S13